MNIKYFIHKHKMLISIIALPLVSIVFSNIALASTDPWHITTVFGEHDSLHQTANGHSGVDIAMPIGTKLASTIDGEVTKIVDAGRTNYGLAIHIKSQDGTEAIYGHLSKVTAHLHEHVSVGQVIAESGNSGASTGAHLHYQCRVLINGKPVNIDPMPSIMKAAIGGNK
jgi:murein DD-endopeptidase MepM/ murein hydrolase activator NlpD